MSDLLFTKLRNVLLTEFTETELSSLCQDIGANYAALPGVGQFGKSREIVTWASEQGKLRALCRRLRELRPEVWESQELAAALRELETAQSRHTASATPLLFVVPVLLALLLVSVIAISSRSGQVTPPPDALTTAPVAPSLNSEQVSPLHSPPTPEQPVALPQARGMLPADTPEPTPSPTAVPSPVPTLSATPTQSPPQHPAVQTILDMNEQLVLFYIGRVDASDLRQFWSGAAWERVIQFGNTTLLRAVRMSPTQRNSLKVSFRYLQPPRLLSQVDVGATVSSREAWKYDNPLSDVQVCDVRDYTYELIQTGGRWVIRAFRSQPAAGEC